jgi:hypothetical protein
LDAANCLAPDRTRLLFQLRQAPQPHFRTATRDAGGNKTHSLGEVLTPAAATEAARRTGGAKSKQRFGTPAKCRAVSAF